MTNNKEPKMELNRLSISIISVLITLAISLSIFAYRTGTMNNELRNIKENVIRVEVDYKISITKIEEKKADKQIVDLIFEELKKVSNKLDRLIENKIGEKK